MRTHIRSLAILLALLLLFSGCGDAASSAAQPSYESSSSVVSEASGTFKSHRAPSSSIHSTASASSEVSQIAPDLAESNGSSQVTENEERNLRAENNKVMWTADPERIVRLDELQQKENLQNSEEIRELVDLMLDKAGYLVFFGNLDDFYGGEDAQTGEPARGVWIWGNRKANEAVEVPATQTNQPAVYSYFPLKTVPYSTVQEMREDFQSIFTEQVMKEKFRFWFPNDSGRPSTFMDIDGKLYANGSVGATAYVPLWDLTGMDVLSHSEEIIQIQMPVQIISETQIATLTLVMEDGRWNFTESYYGDEG